MKYVLQLVVFSMCVENYRIFIPIKSVGCMTHISNVAAIFVQWYMPNMFTVGVDFIQNTIKTAPPYIWTDHY